jgi:hypothetical protein
MSNRNVPDDRTEDWHLSPGMLTAYANGLAGTANSWSTEEHLVSCARCRAEIALVMPGPERTAIAGVRAALLTSLPPPTSRRTETRWAAAPTIRLLLLHPAAVLAVIAALIVAVLLDTIWVRVSDQIGAGTLLRLLASVLPLAGVALSGVGERDPWREAVLAAPSSGLRLTLWRTAVVLVVALPSATLVGLVLGGSGPALWLLPCLALTAAVLALGTVITLEWAATAVGLSWGLLTLGPALLASGGRLGAVLQQATPSASWTPAVFTAPAQAIWALTAVTAVTALYLRRDFYERLPQTTRGRTA